MYPVPILDKGPGPSSEGVGAVLLHWEDGHPKSSLAALAGTLHPHPPFWLSFQLAKHEPAGPGTEDAPSRLRGDHSPSDFLDSLQLLIDQLY